MLAYSGDDELGWRVSAEERLLANDVKALISTSALGMGFDKPDLGFVVHFQAPGSAIAYYQQVGRAGRALDASVGVLLRGHEDQRIQDYFLDAAFPDPVVVQRVLDAMSRSVDPPGIGDLELTAGVSRGRITALLKQLEVDGAIRRAGRSGWERTDQPWEYPHERVESVLAARRAEQDEMIRYAATPDCRMSFLRNGLDDPTVEPCGICDRCAEATFAGDVDPTLRAAAREHLRTRPVIIEPRRQWPSGRRDVRGRIAAGDLLEPGRAIGRTTDDEFGRLVRAQYDRPEGYSEELVGALAELYRRWNPTPAPTWVCHVPSARPGDPVGGARGGGGGTARPAPPSGGLDRRPETAAGRAGQQRHPSRQRDRGVRRCPPDRHRPGAADRRPGRHSLDRNRRRPPTPTRRRCPRPSPRPDARPTMTRRAGGKPLAYRWAMSRVQTMVQFTDELVGQLEREATRRGCSRSAIVRQAVAEHLARTSLEEDVRRYVESYVNHPQPDVDEWGDLHASGLRQTSTTNRMLDAEEALAFTAGCP